MEIQTVASEFLIQIRVFLPRLGAAAIVYLGFCLGGRILQVVVLKAGEKSIRNQDVLILLGRTVASIALVMGAITALGTMGVNVSALVASLGLTGFALGFAFKDALSNLLAGVLLLIYRPFKRGDRIAVSGFEGKVLEINFRYTVIGEANKKFLIPNSTLFTNAVAIVEIP
jgi:small-conductance mechanosensitive channel